MHDRGSDAQAISAALAATEGSIEKRGSKDRSNAIDRQLEDDQRKFKKECKILLLGTFLCLILVSNFSLCPHLHNTLDRARSLCS